jgi:hypothetical protein
VTLLSLQNRGKHCARRAIQTGGDEKSQTGGALRQAGAQRQTLLDNIPKIG